MPTVRSPRAPLVIDAVRTDDSTASARFRIGRSAATVSFGGVAPDQRTAPEAFVAAARVMAMETGRVVVSSSPLGRTFRRRIDDFQRVHLSLFPSQRPAPLVAPPRRAVDGGDDSRRVAAFFSGGVDSFHLALEHHDEIDDLVFVRGFDVPVSDHERNEEVLVPVRDGAAALGKPLLVLDTDLREFSDRWSDWTWFSYGGLIAVSLLLARTHRRVLCAASVADAHLPAAAVRARALGVGNERSDFRIEGRGETRVAKLERVVDSRVADRTLRVCWQNVPGTLNCGRCVKCVRTTAALAALGRLGQVATLPVTVDLDAVAAQPAASRSDRAFLAEVLVAARDRGADELVRAAGAALAAGRPVS